MESIDDSNVEADENVKEVKDVLCEKLNTLKRKMD